MSTKLRSNVTADDLESISRLSANRNEVSGLVNPTPHARTAAFAAAIGRCQPVAFVGKLLRVTGMDYANRHDILSGDGSLQYGGRYNPKGGFRAIYASLEFDTATAELLAHHRHQGRPDPEAEVFPVAAVSLEVDVDRLLDLTNASTRRTLKVKLKDLIGDWQKAQDRGGEGLTQAIGRLALAAGFQGLLVPSTARRGGRNVVLFRELIAQGRLRIIRKEKLPKKT
jgi:RES domain-containing protein